MSIKKAFSLFMSLVMVATIMSTVACAEGGYGDSSDFVEDDISDAVVYDVDPAYTVCYNDFETLANPNLSSYVKVVDSGDSAYGKVLQIQHTGWHVPGSSTYTWNGKTYTTFAEPCTVGKSYIMSFDSYVDADAVGSGISCSISPQHSDFYSADSKDHRFYPRVDALRTWNRNIVQFTASESTLKTKINTCATGIRTLIDNLIVVEAADIEILDKTGSTTIKDIYGNIVQGEISLTGGIWAPLGQAVKFKVETTGLATVGTVMMGETEITPDADGNYYISKLTDSITVSTEIDEEVLNAKVSIIENDAYIPFGSTKLAIAYDTGFSKGSISITDASGAELDYDAKLSLTDKISFGLGTLKTDNYSINFLGDYNSDGAIQVTDILAAVDHALSGTADISTIAADVDRNGKITVSDVITNRKALLKTDNTVYETDEALVAEMDAFVQDVITRSSVTGIDTSTLEKGIYNQGNRTRIANVMRKAMRGEDITIAYFGGSITARAGHGSLPDSASGLSPNFATSENSYTDWITYWWKQMFEEKYGITVNVQNAGIGATDTPYAVHRMHYDVLPYDPDLVIVEWCVNDDKNLTYKQGTYEAMVRQFLEHEDVALLMLSMSTRTGGSSQALHEPISELYDVPMVSYRDAYMDNPLFTYFTTDATHPNKVGHPLAGLLVDYYLQGVYEDVATIGNYDSPVTDTMVHEEADDYDGAYIASFKDIYDGKVEGVKITSLGSFAFETTQNAHGFRSYYGLTAKAASSYQPLVIEIDDLKTAFILVNRDGMNNGSTFEIDINGERKVDNSSYTCKHGSDNDQTESKYHWCTTRICYYPDGEKVVMKIYPTIDYSVNSSSYVRLFALMLS